MITLPSTSTTLGEFLQLEETEPASEYMDHKILQKPIAQGRHCLMQLELCNAINQSLKPLKIACALPEIRCTFGGVSLVPDIGVFQWERLPRQNDGEIADRFNIYPDWTIEILSPQQSSTKVIRKILYCLRNGTQLGWLIDTLEKSVLVLTPEQTLEICDTPELELALPQFINELDLDFKLTVRDLFNFLTP